MSQASGPEHQGDGPGQDEPPFRSPGSMHWLVRVAERAGLAGGESLDVPPGTQAREAWPVIVRAFSISEQRLAELVAEYFRLEAADRPTDVNIAEGVDLDDKSLKDSLVLLETCEYPAGVARAIINRFAGNIPTAYSAEELEQIPS